MIAYIRAQIDSVFKFCGNLLDKQDPVYSVSYNLEVKRMVVFNKLTASFEDVMHIEGNPHTILSLFSKDIKLLIHVNLD